jgi:hypothetical protein
MRCRQAGRFRHVALHALCAQALLFSNAMTFATDRLDETPKLAAAGYQYVNQRFQRDSQYDQEWARHFKRLAQRQTFPIDRESYFCRPLDLLGICIGAQSCPALGDSDRQWLKAILDDGAGRLPEQSRAHYLGAVAANQLGVTWTLHSTPRLQDLSLASLSLLYWLIGQQPLAPSIGLAVSEKELAAAVLRQTSNDPISPTSTMYRICLARY